MLRFVLLLFAKAARFSQLSKMTVKLPAWTPTPSAATRTLNLCVKLLTRGFFFFFPSVLSHSSLFRLQPHLFHYSARYVHE